MARFLSVRLFRWVKYRSIVDVLTDILSNLRLRGHMYFRTELAGSWGVSLPADGSTIRFHLVVQGQCFLSVDGLGAPLRLREGDFALVPHGAGQTLSDSPDADSVALEALLDAGALGEDGVLRHGDEESSPVTRLVCGFCSFDDELNHPLFVGLPPALVMGQHAAGNSPWLAEAVRVITMEANLNGLGGPAIISRLMEVLFIQAVRHHRDSPTGPDIAYLAAITDPNLKLAIEAMHERPEEAWTLSTLARLSNMSRSRFAHRFKEVVGRAPLQYLAEWRLQKARRLLAETSLGVAEVAFRSGYQSLPSFTRRFGKHFGITPGAFRKGYNPHD